MVSEGRVKIKLLLDNGYALCNQLMLWIRAALLCIRLGFTAVLTLLHSGSGQQTGFWKGMKI